MSSRGVLLACLTLIACDSTPAPPVAVAEAADVVDEFVLELIHEHSAAALRDPKDAELRGTLGLVYQANRMWSWAAQSFTNAATLDPENEHWGYYSALAHYRAGDSEAGDRLIEAVAIQAPDFMQARFRYGISLIDRGELDLAVEEFAACTKLRPEFAEGWVSLAEALVLLDQPEAALRHLDKVLNSAPGFKRARYVRGLALRALGRAEDAAKELEAGAGGSRGLMPDDLSDRLAEYAMSRTVKLSRAAGLVKTGHFAEALAMAESGLEKRPDDILLLNAQASALRRMKKPERAIEILNRARQLDPSHVGTLTILSGAHFDLRDFGRSLEAAEAAAQLSPKLGLAHFLCGRSLLGMTRMPEASKALRLSIQLDPSRSRAYVYLAESLSAQARYIEAEPIWKQAVEREPGNLPVLFNLGVTQVSLLKVEEARLTLEAIRKFDLSVPRNRGVEQNLAAAISKLTGE